jgi:predicted O-linked N-acetylglucosamine transferase (SPINDLY family)
MGAEYMDYLIADSTIIPSDQREHYSEKIIYLPSYQANDAERRVADREFSRAELGLPDTGFVFCCFNGNLKMTPETFASWMRILARVPKSVLFLYAANPAAAANLRMEAVRSGIGAERLVFGERLPGPGYLARYRAADLFLDTLPYNAGTTASDALWAGLPVLTRTGEAFAGRVAASLLKAAGLPELITRTQEEYEALAIELATDAPRLAQLKQRLAENRHTMRLFDTKLFTRHLESAYALIHERYLADLPTDHVYVAS